MEKHDIEGGASVALRWKIYEEDKAKKTHDFHHLWTACVGTPHYDKKHWNEVCTQLVRAGIIRG